MTNDSTGRCSVCHVALNPDMQRHGMCSTCYRLTQEAPGHDPRDPSCSQHEPESIDIKQNCIPCRLVEQEQVWTAEGRVPSCPRDGLGGAGDTHIVKQEGSGWTHCSCGMGWWPTAPAREQ